MMPTCLKRLALLCALGTASSGLLAGPAEGAGLSPVVADCFAHGQLTHSYTVAQLRNAVATIPVDVNEYTTCHDAIQRALLAKVGKLNGGGSGGAGGSFLPTSLLVVLLVLDLGGVGFGVAALRQPQHDH